MSKKENLYIAMFRFGAKKMSDGLSREDMINYLRDNEIAGAFSESGNMTSLFERTWGLYFFNPGNSTKSKQIFLSPEGYFKLLGYEELEHARESAKASQVNATKAIIRSNWSIGISGFLALFLVLVNAYKIWIGCC